MPTWAATACAVAALSPVIIQTSRPSALSWAMASADSGLTVSATVITAASSPSTATYIGVSPRGGRRVGDRRQVGDVDAGAVHQRRRCRPAPGGRRRRRRGRARGRRRTRSSGGQRRGRASRAAVDDRLGDRVLAAGLGGATRREHLGLGPSRRSVVTPVRAGRAPGDGAGLVEDDGGEPPRLLERLAVADQDAELGGAAGADHDRGRRGQAEGAGAGDDQHRDRGGDRHRQVLGVRPEQRPEQRRWRAAPRMTAGTKTDETLSASRCIGTLEPWASSTRRTIWASAVSSPTAVVRIRTEPVVLRVAPMTGSPAVLSTGQALAGQHALVDGGGAADDDAVDRDLLAGTDPDDVADDDLLDRDVDLDVVPEHAGGLRCQPDQGGDGGGGALLGAAPPSTSRPAPARR